MASAQIIINEIYPDPDPSIGLPDAEFVEVMNIGSSAVAMLDWEISDATSSRDIITDIELQPGEIAIIIADENEEFFTDFGTLLLVSSLPSLNNTGDEISITSPEGMVTDFIPYETSWYDDVLKDDGGFTLERRNPLNSCDGEANWTASNSPIGGTPGQVNTVFDDTFIDTSMININTLFFTDENVLEIVFNKAPDIDQLINQSNFTITPNLPIASISQNNDLRIVFIEFAEPLIQDQVYEFTYDGIIDCAGLSSIVGSNIFGLTSLPVAGEILLNEILFNPATGGVDFVEIINVSDRLFGFDGLSILELDVDTDDVIDFERLEDINRYMLPDELYVLTSDNAIILEQYDVVTPDNLVEASIPNYLDDFGKVAIVNELTDEIDSFEYNEDFHAPTLNRVDGVSLERISLSSPTQQESNWFSASFIAGNATPTGVNSQTGNVSNLMGDEILLSGEVFTPDGDGMDDFLIISFPGIQDQATATVRIFDARGYQITTLLNNQIIGQQNQIRWNGEDENVEAVPIGHYFIVAEIFDQNGDEITLREKVVVSRRF